VKQNLVEMILLFLTFYLPGMLFQAQGLQLAQDSPGRYMMEAVLAAAAQLALFLYLLWLRRANRRSDSRPSETQPFSVEGSPWARFGLGRLRYADLLQGAFVFVGASALLLAANFLLSLLPAEGRELLSEGFRFRLKDWRLVPLALLFGVVTGYREELYFRGYLITRLMEFNLPSAAAAAASCLLFALGHLYQGTAGFVTALLLGALFGVLFIRRPNLHRLAIAHGLYNTMVLVASLWVL
jgi:membrane protease YdiL (CAAX protease family)